MLVTASAPVRVPISFPTPYRVSYDTSSTQSRLIFTGLWYVIGLLYSISTISRTWLLSFGCATSAATVSRLILSVRKESVTKRRLGLSNRCTME